MDYEKLIRELVDRKAEQDNQIDLHAYENGMRAITEALSLHNISNRRELLIAYEKKPLYTTGMGFSK